MPSANLLLAALTQMTGSFTQAVDGMAALLKTLSGPIQRAAGAGTSS